jgi:hypothetical protein
MKRRPDEPEDIEALLRASRGLHDAPEPVIGRVLGMWRVPGPSAPANASPRRAIERFVAALRSDSAALSPLALGLRSTVSPVRQLLYSVAGRDIDLRLSRPDGGGPWRVAGQVFGPDARGAAVLSSDAYSARCDWNDLSEFTFDTVPAGRFRLLLQAGDSEIEVPHFDLVD